MGDRADELKGRVKKGVGKVAGDERLQAEGEADVAEARTRRKTKGALREVGGTLKEGVGKLSGDETTEVEGKAERLRGKSEQAG
jgi:uncharacterized protein YjbJ (UPF0337 family)